MRALSSLLKTYSALVRCAKSTIDYLLYLTEEFRNSERHAGWAPDEMTTLLTAQEGTREEQQLARQRREFWARLMNEEKESNGIAVN